MNCPDWPCSSGAFLLCSKALDQADPWVEFVGERKADGRATVCQQPDPAEVEESRCDKIEAQRRWGDM